MAMKIKNLNGAVKLNGSPVSAPAHENYPVTDYDLVETSAGGSVNVTSDGVVAANVSGANSTVTTYSPPTQSLDHVYYNYSYRYRLRAPGGYVGIRG